MTRAIARVASEWGEFDRWQHLCERQRGCQTALRFYHSEPVNG